MTGPTRPHTQISGSYRETNACLFPLRRALIRLGYDVRHPMNDHFTGTVGNTGATYDTTTTFSDVERSFYGDIATCRFHVLADCTRHDGYLGASAARETSWAVVHGVPVVIAHEIRLIAADVDTTLRRILELNAHAFVPLADPPRITHELDAISDRRPTYKLTQEDDTFVRATVERYLSGLDAHQD